jgi:peptidoglycan biosynthesis/recognition FemAB-like protein
MSKFVRDREGGYVTQPGGAVRLLSRADLARCSHWQGAFAGKRKDHRYYELVEDTIRQGFDYRYFAVEDERGEVIAIQPAFLLDQDLVAGVSVKIKSLVETIRGLWPRFLKMRTLMVGCVAGEGHLDGDELLVGSSAERLAAAIVTHARHLKAGLIVLKEFPAKYREPLRCFLRHGFSRAPSLPMTRLNIDYASFDEYMEKALNSATRRKLRKKFAASAQAPAIEMSVASDIAPAIDELYPLYLQVYERSKLHFEKLTKEYFCGLGRLMPDKVRFFIWRQEGRAIAFTLCMIEGDALFAEYIGLDYRVALDLHLYHYAVRDMTSWAIANGYKWLRSSGLNYDPKLHLRHKLDPIDLYVRHTSPIANAVLRRLLPLIEPTRYDPILKKFANYAELWEES